MSKSHLTVHLDISFIIVICDALIKLTLHENLLVSLFTFTVINTALKAHLFSFALSTELPELEKKQQYQLTDREKLKIELGKLLKDLLYIIAKVDLNIILCHTVCISNEP